MSCFLFSVFPCSVAHETFIHFSLDVLLLCCCRVLAPNMLSTLARRAGTQAASAHSRHIHRSAASMRVYDNILETIGDTPVVRLNKLSPRDDVTIYAKAEYVATALLSAWPTSVCLFHWVGRLSETCHVLYFVFLCVSIRENAQLWFHFHV